MNQISQFHYTNFFSDSGIFKELLTSNKYPWESLALIEKYIESFKNSSDFIKYREVSRNVFVGENVTIDDTARIVESAIIGHNSHIGHAAYLRNGVLIGDNVHVGHATEVKHSIVLSGSHLAHLNYIGDSIVGSNVNISGGATLANWRFDKSEIEIKFGDKKISTKMEKFGSIIGDDSFIGVNAVLNPGTILGKKTIVYPLVSVRGVHTDSEALK